VVAAIKVDEGKFCIAFAHGKFPTIFLSFLIGITAVVVVMVDIAVAVDLTKMIIMERMMIINNNNTILHTIILNINNIMDNNMVVMIHTMVKKKIHK
jgi:hypothetical protein